MTDESKAKIIEAISKMGIASILACGLLAYVVVDKLDDRDHRRAVETRAREQAESMKTLAANSDKELEEAKLYTAAAVRRADAAERKADLADEQLEVWRDMVDQIKKQVEAIRKQNGS